MQLIGLQKTFEIPCGANRMRRGPFQFQQEHGVISHAARTADHGLDRRVERLDDTEADWVKAVCRDALEVFGQECAQALHLVQALPTERLEPSQQKVADALRRLIGPEAIELLPQHVSFKQPPVHREELLELAAFRATHCLPPPEEQPALAPADGPQRGAGAEELPPAQFVERVGGVLQYMEL